MFSFANRIANSRLNLREARLVTPIYMSKSADDICHPVCHPLRNISHAPARFTEPVVVYSLGVVPLLPLSLSRARATPRGVARRRADSSRVGSSRAERCRAVPSAGVERSRTKASRWPRRARVALHRRSVCVRVRARLYPLRSPLLVRLSKSRASPPARTRAEQPHTYPSSSSASASPASRKRLEVIRISRIGVSSPACLVSSRVCVCAPRPFRLARARAWTTRAHEPTRI